MFLKKNLNNFKITIFFLSLILLLGASFELGIIVFTPDVEMITTEVNQLNNTVFVGGGKIYFTMPIIYNVNITKNVSVEKPEGWISGNSWVVYENGSVVFLTENSTHFTWEADPDNTNISLHFKANSPTITTTGFTNTSSFFQKNMTVSALVHFVNVSASIPASQQHTYFNLYWFDGTSYIDRTNFFNLEIINGSAQFSEFNTSEQYFILEGYCQESWICTTWSQSSCGTRICTDQNSCGTQLSKPTTLSNCNTGTGGSSSSSYSGNYHSSNSNTDINLEIKTTEQEISLQIMPEIIIINANRGEEKVYSLSIQSQTDSLAIIESRIKPVSNILKTNKEIFSIEANRAVPVNLEVKVPSEDTADKYVFELQLSSKNYLKIATVVIIVNQPNITTQINSQKTIVDEEDNFKFMYKIINFDNELNMNASSLFYLRNSNGVVKKILKKDRFLLEKNSITLIEEELSNDMPSGSYELCGQLEVNNSIYTQCENMIIRPKVRLETPRILKGESDFQDKKAQLGIILVFIFLIVLVTIKIIVNRHKKYFLGIPKSIETKDQLINYIIKQKEQKLEKLSLGEENNLGIFLDIVLNDPKLGNKIKKLKSKEEILRVLTENNQTKK